VVVVGAGGPVVVVAPRGEVVVVAGPAGGGLGWDADGGVGDEPGGAGDAVAGGEAEVDVGPLGSPWRAGALPSSAVRFAPSLPSVPRAGSEVSWAVVCDLAQVWQLESMNLHQISRISRE
jgi:hypothetical protein